MSDNKKDTRPLDENGNPMKTFRVKMRKQSNDTVEKAIFIDDEVLDWAIDISSLMEAHRMGPKFVRAAQKDIAKHFAESVSEVLGRKVTVEQIKRATNTGWI